MQKILLVPAPAEHAPGPGQRRQSEADAAADAARPRLTSFWSTAIVSVALPTPDAATRDAATGQRPLGADAARRPRSSASRRSWRPIDIEKRAVDTRADPAGCRQRRALLLDAAAQQDLHGQARRPRLPDRPPQPHFPGRLDHGQPAQRLQPPQARRHAERPEDAPPADGARPQKTGDDWKRSIPTPRRRRRASSG